MLQAGKVLSFVDIYLRLKALRESVAKFRDSNARGGRLLENAGQLDSADQCAAAVETAAAPLLNLTLDPRCIRCRAKRAHRIKAVTCSPLARFYLQYRIIEALQPLPVYESDDGFQPLQVILSLRFDDDPKAEQALAEFRGRELPILQIVAGLVERGIVIQTPFEPWNGDVMLGLPEYQYVREAAYEERKRLIAGLAKKCGHAAGWNADGTGWLTSPCRNSADIRGSVWDLLSYLNLIEISLSKRPRSLH